ncbi:MAG: hypothetical protein ACHQIM_19865 [Sphingobacteriales bacterium]
MNLFLRAKHWQLFLLSFGIPLLLEIVMMASIFSHLLHQANVPPDPYVLFGYFNLFPVIMLLFMGTMLGWQWSVATGLQKLLPAGITMKVTMFKTFLIIPVIYICLILGFMSYFVSAGFHRSEVVDYGIYISISFAVIIPLHLFSMFCLFYCLYFVAKTLKTVELQREAGFSDFAGEFFLTWFFPIGVWILQPRINKMIKDHEPVDEPGQQD